VPEASDDGFEWDDAKNIINLKRHEIDFEDAIAIWRGPVLERQSDRHGEERWLTIGTIGDRILAVAWTKRGSRRRIISARPARRGSERKDYQAFVERSAPGPH
jgi:uncharacterized DUF497 family protein